MLLISLYHTWHSLVDSNATDLPLSHMTLSLVYVDATDLPLSHMILSLVYVDATDLPLSHMTLISWQQCYWSPSITHDTLIRV